MNVSKRDAGVSEVISFVMILSMLIIAFSLWALYAVLAGGELYIYKNTESGINLNPDTMNTKIGRLSAQIGGTRGSTVIGYEGGGVFRSDNGNAVWLTPGLLQIYPDATQKNATVSPLSC